MVSDSILVALIAAVALVLSAWVLGRALKIGLAAAGKHIGTAVATGWAAPGLIPEDDKAPAAGEVDTTTEIQGVDTRFLDAVEVQEMEWVDEICNMGGNATEQQRAEAFERLDYYQRVAFDRAAGRTPFAQQPEEVHPDLRAVHEPVVRYAAR